MPTPLPARNIFDGTASPVTSVMKSTMGSLRDYLAGLLGTTGAGSDALIALGAISQDFYKTDGNSVVFIKTAAGTVSIKAGSKVKCAGVVVEFNTDTAVTMPTLTAGTDYAIYVCTDSTIRADASFSAPSGYTTANSLMIGGFHYSAIAAGTTVGIAAGFSNVAAVTRAGTTTNASAVVTGLASTADLHKGMDASGTGVPAGANILTVDSASQVTLTVAATATGSPSITFTNTGMVWTQADVDAIAGINRFSLWDLKFRPKSSPKGMALVNGAIWADIYLCSTDTAANGTSKYNSNVASGTVLPKIPAAFGGNGTVTYPSLNWWVANELARSNQKRMLFESEFVDLAFGVFENTSLGGAAVTISATAHEVGFTSKHGIEQASGHQWTWGQDSNFSSEVASPAGGYKQVNGNTGAAGSERGQVYSYGTYGVIRAIFGGARGSAGASGSRAAVWSSLPWGGGNWSFSLRAVCEHMISA